jgi:ATP-dependent Clp protease protease subunit
MNEINVQDDDEKANKRFDPIGEKLMKSRIIMITDVITKRLAQRTIGQLLILEQEDPEKEIKVFINSPGGDADAGFAIYDMMKFIKPKIKNVCAGVAASAAVIILLGTGKENRVSLPNSRILIHQPSTGVHGTASDIQIEASEILKCREKINRMISDETNREFEKVENDTKRNYWMSAEEAVEYGLISKIINTQSDLL